MPALETRLNAYRPDLADNRLRGKVEAERFVEGVAHHIRAPLAAVRQRPSSDAPLDTEGLMGETVLVFESEEGWCWGQLVRDGYVGYLPQEALAPGRARRRIGWRRSGAFSIPAPQSSCRRLAFSPSARSRRCCAWRRISPSRRGLHLRRASRAAG